MEKKIFNIDLKALKNYNGFSLDRKLNKYDESA